MTSEAPPPDFNIIEREYLSCSGADLSEVVAWATRIGADFDHVSIQPAILGNNVWGVVAVWYANVADVPENPYV